MVKTSVSRLLIARRLLTIDGLVPTSGLLADRPLGDHASASGVRTGVTDDRALSSRCLGIVRALSSLPDRSVGWGSVTSARQGYGMQYEVRNSPGVTEILLKGRMGFSDHQMFRDIMGIFNGPVGHRIVFNLAGLEFIDSSGLGMFVIARDEAKKKSLDFSIERVNPEVKKLMDVARFDRFFTIRP